MRRLVFQLFILLFFSGCISESFNIPGSWSFTIIRKKQDVEICPFDMPQDITTVLVYYPEICGFCLSQIDELKAELLKIRTEEKRSNIRLICVISTKDIGTLQYYLDEKMDSMDEIYIDPEDNIRKEFFSEAQISYPYYFVIQGNTIKKMYEMNKDKSSSQIVSLFFKSDYYN